MFSSKTQDTKTPMEISKKYRIWVQKKDDYVEGVEYDTPEEVKNHIATHYNKVKDWAFFEDGDSTTQSVKNFHEYVQYCLEENMQICVNVL